MVLGFIVLPIMILIGGPIYCSYRGIHVETGRGEHVGYVTAVETNGWLFKTQRAYVKTDTQSSQEDAYCVTDSAVVEELKRAAEQHSHVKVSFEAWMVWGWAYCKQAEAALINRVEILAPR